MSDTLIFNAPNDDDDESSDPDSISTTSTLMSTEEYEQEFPVKGLLADKECPIRKCRVYLVHWEGYPIERATWEPPESFEGEEKREMIAEYERRKTSHDLPFFDWEQWDRDRDREEQERADRRRRRRAKRERKRRKRGQPTPSRSSESSDELDHSHHHDHHDNDDDSDDDDDDDDDDEDKDEEDERLQGFIVSDDSGLDEFEDDLPSDLEISKRKRALRGRKRRQVPIIKISDSDNESDSSSDADSLMEALRSKAKKPKEHGKEKGKENDKEKGKAKGKEKGKEKPKNKGKANGKGKVPPPTKRIEKNTKQQSERRAVPRKRALTKSPPRNTKRPATNRPGDSKRQKKPPAAAPSRPVRSEAGRPMLYNKLSILNTVQKSTRAREDRAPPAEELNLYKLGEDPRPKSTETPRPANNDVEQARRTCLTSVPRIPQQEQPAKRKRTPPVEAARPSAASKPGPGPGCQVAETKLPPSGEQPPPAKRHAGDTVLEPLVENTKPPIESTPVNTKRLSLATAIQKINIRPAAQSHQSPQSTATPINTAWTPQNLPFDPMDIDQPLIDISAFLCQVEYGPSASSMMSMGNVKFLGFGNEFLAMLKDINLEKMWISKSLENMYIQKVFVPAWGLPLEYVDLIPQHDKFEPFTTVLSIFHGAGVVVHPEFTLIVFQPSNDWLRSAFKTPQQRYKSPLRAVLYPPLDVEVPVPSMHTAPMHTAFDPGFDHYQPNLMSRVLPCYGKLLAEKVHPDLRSFCYTYCPEVSKAERIELESALRLRGHRILKSHDISEVEKRFKTNPRKQFLVVLVHQSLRYQLHLLPHMRLMRNLTNVTFYFFGMKLQYQSDPMRDCLIHSNEMFWFWGTLILITPKFIANNHNTVMEVVQYQRMKPGSTTLGIVPRTVERIEKYVTVNLRNDRGTGERILRSVYALEDLLKSNGAIEIPMDYQTLQAKPSPASVSRRLTDEIEPGEIRSPQPAAEIDLIVDRFALFHLENATKYRRFVVCHSIKEDVEDSKKIFPTIEFWDPETTPKKLNAGTQNTAPQTAYSKTV